MVDQSKDRIWKPYLQYSHPKGGVLFTEKRAHSRVWTHPKYMKQILGANLGTLMSNFGNGIKKKHYILGVLNLSAQNLRHHRRPKRQHRCPIHHHPASIPTVLGHRFVSPSDQKSCSNTCSLFLPLSGITSKFTLNRHPPWHDTSASSIPPIFRVRILGGQIIEILSSVPFPRYLQYSRIPFQWTPA